MDLHQNPSFEYTYNQFKYDTDIELAGKITVLAAQINAATYLFLKLLAEFDSRKGWCKDCIRSCTHWLNLSCAMANGTAREKLRVAHCLERLPKINEAFEDGGLSYSKVRAMTRVATDDNEQVLLNFAATSSASQLDKLVRRFQRVDEKQQVIKQGDELTQRSLTCYQDEEGMWVLNAKLPQLEGGLFIKAIEEIVRQQDKSLAANKGKSIPAEAGVEEKITFSQKRADALSALAEHFIATATVDDENGGIQALAGHERCQVVLHLNAETLRAEHEHGANCGCAHLPPPYMDNHCISMANAKRFSSDASLYTVLEGKYGDILNLSRKTRTVNSALLRALNLRDETCRFPGCCADKYVDFHHIQHWSNLGETEPDNLIKLCRFHHAQLHKGKYSIMVQPQTKKNHGQKWIFKNAAGQVIENNPTLPIPATNDFMEKHWPDITGIAKKSRWLLNTMNYPAAIKDLLWCKYRHQAGYPRKKPK